VLGSKFKISFYIGIAMLSSGLVHAEPTEDKTYKDQEWGLGFVGRYANVPYVGDDSSVSDVMPMLYFENKYIYLDGLDYGVKAYEDSRWRASIVSKLRYVDMPKDEQNEYLEDAVDVGIALRYKISDSSFVDVAAMSDLDERYYGYLKYSALMQYDKLEYRPFAEIRWSDGDFNKFYYGHDEENVGSGFDGAIGVDGRYHLVSNLYLIGGLQGRYIGAHAKNNSFLDDDFEASASLGVAMMANPFSVNSQELTTKPYVRLAYAWATPSDLADILSAKGEDDENNNQLASVFYGHPLSNDLFGLPIDMYLTPGVVYHKSSSVQKSSMEYVLAFKGYYTTPTKYRFRFGIAEGLSYADDVPYIESHEMEEKGYDASKLMNYADFTVDVNLGDIFSEKLDDVWLGAGIHHRSSMFESSSMFGRIKGGSNYNSVYVQWHF